MLDIADAKQVVSGSPIALDFGAAFRRERRALGRSQQWVAERSGLTRFTIAQLEAGHNVGINHVLAALASLGKELSIVPRPWGL
jgi:transcriptional regulator with XRE-family HTH domain